MIHSLGGNIDVRAGRWREVVECEVNAFVSGFLPFAGRTIFGGG